MVFAFWTAVVKAQSILYFFYVYASVCKQSNALQSILYTKYSTKCAKIQWFACSILYYTLALTFTLVFTLLFVKEMGHSKTLNVTNMP